MTPPAVVSLSARASRCAPGPKLNGAGYVRPRAAGVHPAAGRPTAPRLPRPWGTDRRGLWLAVCTGYGVRGVGPDSAFWGPFRRLDGLLAAVSVGEPTNVAGCSRAAQRWPLPPCRVRHTVRHVRGRSVTHTPSGGVGELGPFASALPGQDHRRRGRPCCTTAPAVPTRAEVGGGYEPISLQWRADRRGGSPARTAFVRPLGDSGAGA